MKNLTDDTFDEFLASSTVPVLVDFTANWCGPCRTMTPIVDVIAGEYKDRLKVAQVDVDDDCEDITDRYCIQAIPTLLLFRGQEIIAHLVGAISRYELVTELEKHLGEKKDETRTK